MILRRLTRKKRVRKGRREKLKLKSQGAGPVSLLSCFSLGCICEMNKENSGSKSGVDLYRY